jgi:hypothetical protein
MGPYFELTGFNGDLTVAEAPVIKADLSAKLHATRLQNQLTREETVSKNLQRSRLRESVDIADFNWLSVFADYLNEVRRDGFMPGIGTIDDHGRKPKPRIC